MAESLEAYERVQKAAADKKRAELEAKRKALAEKLMVHGALAQRTCMAANFAFWGFCEVRIHGVLRSSLAGSGVACVLALVQVAPASQGEHHVPRVGCSTAPSGSRHH